MEGVFDVMQQENVFRIRNIDVGDFYVVAMNLETDKAYIIERNTYEAWQQNEYPLYWVFALDMSKAVETDGQPLYMLQELLNAPLPDEKKISLEELRESRCPMTVRKRRREGSLEAEIIARGETGDFYRFCLPFEEFWMDDEVCEEKVFHYHGEEFRYKTMSVAPVAVYEGSLDE